MNDLSSKGCKYLGGRVTLDKIRIEGADPEEIILFLDSTLYFKHRYIWRLEERKIGVFAGEPVVTAVLAVILDHDNWKYECAITVFSPGGRQSLIDFGQLSSRQDKLVRSIMELAKDKGWNYTSTKGSVKTAGLKCPSCGASYIYKEEKFKEDGSVRIMNCGNPFIPRQNKTDSPPDLV